jgi:hypothetical protein
MFSTEDRRVISRSLKRVVDGIAYSKPLDRRGYVGVRAGWPLSVTVIKVIVGSTLRGCSERGWCAVGLTLHG